MSTLSFISVDKYEFMGGGGGGGGESKDPSLNPQQSCTHESGTQRSDLLCSNLSSNL